MPRVLVTGATGRLGRLVTQQLLGPGVEVRVLTRRPQAAAELFGQRVEVVVGDFSDQVSLDQAVAGVERLFLLSPISEHLVEQQVAVIDAAVRGEVQRIVKISGSHWTIKPPGQSISGEAHARVEDYLRKQGLPSAVVRPNAWMQGSLPPLIASARSGRPMFAAYGDAEVGFIDARDIADVAVHQLLSDEVAAEPLVITGSEALRVRDVARLCAALLQIPVSVTSERPDQSPAPFPANSFEGRAVAEFMVLIRDGRAAALTDTVPRLLGRAPRTVRDFLSEQLLAVAA